MDKLKIFEKEINYIRNRNYQEDLKKLIEGLPDYFFEIEASSTGKYHPRYALGSGGLVRHTKAAVRIAVELLNDPSIGDKYTERERDLMILSLVLHDGLKCGNPKEQYTRADHPLVACEYIKSKKEELSFNEEDLKFVSDVIASHMGPWNTHPYTKEEILPKPKTRYQNFVHMCDYLASRKCILLEFDENNNVIG